MLNFLKYISDKELTGSEYIVLTIIYKDTRYGNGCYKSIRQFLDHTPFTASKTTISSTINSLVEKGYVEREYDKNLDAIFLTAKGVNCEKVVKLPYELKIEKASESLPAPQTKPKKAFEVPTKEQVKDLMWPALETHFNCKVQESFVNDQVQAFFEHYEPVKWKKNNGKPIVSLKQTVSNWVRNTSENALTVSKCVQSTVPTIEAIVDAIRAIYAPMQFSKNWENDRKTALMEQQARAFYAQMTKKNWVLNVGCQTWQDQLQAFAADQYNTLKVLDPDYIPKTKAERDLRNELYTGFKNSDPMNRNSFETMKLILGIDDLGDYENAK